MLDASIFRAGIEADLIKEEENISDMSVNVYQITRSNKYEDSHLPDMKVSWDFDAEQTPTFRRNTLLPTSGLKFLTADICNSLLL
jgi:hypothetical protein